MNLNAIVSSAAGAVNPLRLLTIRISDGYMAGPDGARTPTYQDPIQVWGQLQPLQYQDIVQADGLNIQGIRKKFYLNGHVHGLVRGKREGADMIVTPDNEVWKVAIVTEAWPTWTSGIITLQNNS